MKGITQTQKDKWFKENHVLFSIFLNPANNAWLVFLIRTDLTVNIIAAFKDKEKAKQAASDLGLYWKSSCSMNEMVNLMGEISSESDIPIMDIPKNVEEKFENYVSALLTTHISTF